jgi:hypothetical protein
VALSPGETLRPLEAALGATHPAALHDLLAVDHARWGPARAGPTRAPLRAADRALAGADRRVATYGDGSRPSACWRILPVKHPPSVVVYSQA